MYDWNGIYPHDRIICWRAFRTELDERPLGVLELLNEVSAFWANVPIGARCLDYYNPNTWPTPWEILNYSLFCENTTSLLMYYTIKLLTTFSGTIQLCLIDDETGEYIVPVVESKYVLNVVHGEVVDIRHVKIVEVYDESVIKQMQ